MAGKPRRRFARRLIIVNPNRVLNASRGGAALQSLIGKLRSEQWSPDLCFLSEDVKTTRNTWNQLKASVPQLDSCLEVPFPRIRLAVPFLEGALAQWVSQLTRLLNTVMVITKSPEPEFREFLRYLVGDLDFESSNKAFAFLVSTSSKWSRNQSLENGDWKLIGRDFEQPEEEIGPSVPARKRRIAVKPDDVQSPLGKPDDVESCPGKPDDVESCPGKPEDVESCPGKPDDLQSRPGNPDDDESHPWKPADVESHPGKPDDRQSHIDKPDDVESVSGRPDDVESNPGKPDDLQSRPGNPDDDESRPWKPGDVESHPGKPDDLQSHIEKPDDVEFVSGRPDLQSHIEKHDDVESVSGGPDDVESNLGKPDDLRYHRAKSVRRKRDDASDWTEALKQEDCLRLKELLGTALKEDTNIEAENGDRARKLKEDTNTEAENGDRARKLLGIYVNLNEGPKEDVEASPGRTAVHAAVRRGDLQLLELIVQDILHVDGSCSTQTYCHVLKVRHDIYGLDALAMAVANGNQKIISLLIQTSKDCYYNPFDVRLEHGSGSAPGGEERENTVGQPKEAALHEKDVESMAGQSREPAPREKDGESTAGPSEVNVDELEDKLKSVTADVLNESSPDLATKLYYADNDFNFLEITMYFFHFTFSTWLEDYADFLGRIRSGIFSKVYQDFEDKELLKYLLKLKDGNGRTPLHVAVDVNKVKEFLTLLPSRDEDEDLYKDILNAEDDSGRTPLYRAAAQNQTVAIKELLKDKRVDINARILYRANKWGEDLDVDQLSLGNSFSSNCFYSSKEEKPWKKRHKKSNSQGASRLFLKQPEVSSTALHVAIILKHQDIVKEIVTKLLSFQDYRVSNNVWCHRRLRRPRVAGNATISIHESRISTMKLSVLVDSIPILQTLLKAEDVKPGLFTCGEDEEKLSSFHLAAAMGNVGIVKAFLDSKQGNLYPTKVDCFHHTALHHAVKGQCVRFYPHLVDFVGCDYIPDWRWDSTSQQLATPYQILAQKNETPKLKEVQRRLCINLLLQVGINIWERDVSDKTANPEPDASEEFMKWWYEKEAQEVQRAQDKLNAAANAISVTAALVATASYVGPVQPPLGYGDDGLLQVNVFAMRFYVVCDSLSFYFALAAIMLSLLPALPLSQESVFRELARTRLLVAVAVTCLFPSIVCVLLAFVTGYIAVIPDHGLAHRGFLVATTAFGGLLCFLVMIAFGHRLRKVLMTLPRDVWEEIGL